MQGCDRANCKTRNCVCVDLANFTEDDRSKSNFQKRLPKRVSNCTVFRSDSSKPCDRLKQEGSQRTFFGYCCISVAFVILEEPARIPKLALNETRVLICKFNVAHEVGLALRMAYSF